MYGIVRVNTVSVNIVVYLYNYKALIKVVTNTGRATRVGANFVCNVHVKVL